MTGNVSWTPRANLSHSSTTTAQSDPQSVNSALMGTPDSLNPASIPSVDSYCGELPHRSRRRLRLLFPLPVMLPAFSLFRKRKKNLCFSFSFFSFGNSPPHSLSHPCQDSWLLIKFHPPLFSLSLALTLAGDMQIPLFLSLID